VKVLRPELAAAVGPDRFLREIGIAAKLHHPHILMLLDSGESDGLLYYVMPYVEGETLRHKLMRERELAIREVVAILREVADALAYAHRLASCARSPMRSRMPTGSAWCTGTSSRTTSCCPAATR